MKYSLLIQACSALVVVAGSAASNTSRSMPVQQEAVRVSRDGSVENYCDATANSFGTVARIEAFGSLRLADATFGLRTTGLPPAPQSFGMFTCGTIRTNVPFGNGYLCISPFSEGIHRMRVQPLSASTVDLTMTEDSAGFSLCEPGSTWNFQFWYRDPTAGGAKFNLSDAVGVVFAL